MANMILETDSYKVSHWKQYPPGSQYVHSYYESRGGAYPATLFFGLQYYLMDLFCRPIMDYDIDEAEEFFNAHFGRDMFNRAGWEHILKAHGGYLPLRVRAVPEGTLVPVSNVLMTVENTDPEVPWLTNYLETRLAEIWYPITTATLSFRCRHIIQRHLERTGDPALVDFKLHDFGYRGVSSQESAMIGGMAHLVNFKGTDTMAALVGARNYYNCPMAGFSIPAAEHSTITSWGREHEVDAFRNMLRSYPTGLVAVVSDSYDIYGACEKLWGETLRDEVLARDGVVVIRPDSGDPIHVCTKVLEILGAKFGFTVNAKGYRVLDPHVRVIQGDGVDPVAIDMILSALSNRGWSADNIAFGMGGALLQKTHRDVCSFAFKCSNITVNGVDRPVSKSPVTDPGKASKAGRLSLYRTRKTGEYHTGDVEKHGWNLGVWEADEVMQTVYQDGEFYHRQTFDDVRALAAAQETRQYGIAFSA